MAASADPKDKLTGEVLFYKNPEPLSLEKHRMLGIKKIDRPFKFLATSHVVPITVSEFPVACTSFPIVFSGDTKTPIAVMGGRAGQNVFVSPDGDVDPEAYLPAFVRRYPFAFANEANSDRMIACIDRAAPMLTEGADVPLFNGDQPSQFTQDAIEFCKEFKISRRATIEFVNRMTTMDLWQSKAVNLSNTNPDGTAGDPIKIAEYYCISEEKLNALPANKFLELREENALGIIYTHMISLMLWPKILNRTINIAQAEAQLTQQPAPKR